MGVILLDRQILVTSYAALCMATRGKKISDLSTIGVNKCLTDWLQNQ